LGVFIDNEGCIPFSSPFALPGRGFGEEILGVTETVISLFKFIVASLVITTNLYSLWLGIQIFAHRLDDALPLSSPFPLKGITGF
jgi:hypothetical protein